MLDNYSLIICIAGLLVYVIASEWPVRPWVGEVGRIAFAMGLLAFLLNGVRL